MRRDAVWLMLMLPLAVLAASNSTVHGAIAFSPTGGTGAAASGVRGYEFNVSQTIYLTHLGMWDFGTNGFAGLDPTVEIWDTLATPVAGASATVTDTSPIDGPAVGGGSFRYESIGSPLQLTAGNYVIGGFLTDTNDVLQTVSNAGASSPITFTQNRLFFGVGYGFPATNFAIDGIAYFGPNFKYMTEDEFNATVPEPSSFALAGLCAFGVLIKRRRDRARRGEQNNSATPTVS